MPQTVLSIVSTLKRCGPISVVEGIARDLNVSRHRAVIATLFPNRSDSAVREFRRLGIQVEEMNMSHAACLTTGRRRLRQLVTALSVDLIHCHGFWANLVVATASFDVPRLATIHAQLMNDYQMVHGRVAGAWLGRLEYAALRRFDRVVAVSEAAAEAAGFHNVQCEVILNGIDLNRFGTPAGPSHKAELRKRLILPGSSIVVLHTGALNSLKQPVEVVTGFLASKLSRNAVLVFAGDGPLRQQCEKAAEGAPNVVFLGSREDIPDLLRAGDVLISNSRSEGLPMALLEGCASGVRIIASDIAPHRRVRNEFGEQVFIYHGHNPDDVAVALDAKCPRELEVTVRPSPKALAVFSAQRMSRDYQAVYARYCRGSARRVCAENNQVRTVQNGYRRS